MSDHTSVVSAHESDGDFAFEERLENEAIVFQLIRGGIKELLGCLEPVQRTIVLLKLGVGWQHSQIAEMLLMTNERLACQWAHTKAKLIKWTRHKRPELFPSRKRKQKP